ncbi:MAG: hypothetical protein K8F92_01760 [Hyphomicrobium sp.]|nr:hypothetical protein [Hyphomicrobium sp.]
MGEQSICPARPANRGNDGPQAFDLLIAECAQILDDPGDIGDFNSKAAAPFADFSGSVLVLGRGGLRPGEANGGDAHEYGLPIEGGRISATAREMR